MSHGDGASDWGRQVRAWGKPKDVPDESGVGLQIRHMLTFARREEAGPDFARGWLAGRRAALDAGERVRAPLQRILDDVFDVLEDYVIDPNLRDDDDMSDDELSTYVRAALDRMERL